MTEERFFELTAYERELCAKGHAVIGGLDEAGRGPLAGPVAAGCVIFPAAGPFPKADDSKKLSPKRRDALFDEIKETALGWGVGLADNAEIDRLNILNATYLAMRRAVKAAVECAAERGNTAPELILVDHVHVPELAIPQLSITHGDALSVTIGAASILAKVTRDRLMEQYDAEYPGYGFAGHKGYGTAAHYRALNELGPSPIHRMSFLKKMHGIDAGDWGSR
ncbi:MAG: ribonuclease HII [Clostridia bacterium]|nr:ribonuclease HII [Clostridia bacterium]